MNILIIEDESLTAQNLAQMIRELIPEAEIADILVSIKDSVRWFETRGMPDLVFMDIHLADGSSFSIFDKISVTCPIIFTTAYDEYALRAFEVNSVDYLLKPVNKNSLQRALDKMKMLAGSGSGSENTEMIRKIAQSILKKETQYKSSILIPVRDKLLPIAVKDISYIYVEARCSIIIKMDGSRYELNTPLDEVMKLLNPDDFYRANRQYIISRDAVKEIVLWFNNRIAVSLKLSTPERIIVSKAHVQDFKAWLTQ